MTRRDSQNPLAEGRWLYRRIYAFAISAGLWALLMRTVGRMPAEMLPHAADGLMGLIALMLVLYLVAPTAQQMIAMLANMRLRLAAGGNWWTSAPSCPSRTRRCMRRPLHTCERM